MRLGDAPDSDNFEDRTGQGGGGGFGGGGGVLGLLIPLVASRFGIVGIVILALGYCAITQTGLLSGGGSGPSDSSQSTLSAENRRVLVGVLESTDQVWGQLFAKDGQRYTEPKLVAYTSDTQTRCGMGQAAMGPFYCPGDQSIYIDPVFFNELAQRFNAPGDFPQGYVIAHEVGHHIQNLKGTLDRSQRTQARLNKAAGNQVQVDVELQADCYAGVWAATAKDNQGRPLLEPGDLEEGMRAAEAIGDDMLTPGKVSPDNFTHGTSAQRMEALRRGLSTGNAGSCDYAR